MGRRRVVRLLKDGYWDRTEVVELDDGSVRVRKRTKGNAPPGPWGVAALRKEIEYLSTLSGAARAAFPALLAVWDDASQSPPDVGYEVPFYPDHIDAGELCRSGALTQPAIDEFQNLLADTLFERVHPDRSGRGPPLSTHLESVVEHALATLERDYALAPLIRADTLRLNGERSAGPRAAFAEIRKDRALLASLDAQPQVRLHGDLFLENVLWRSTPTTRAGAGNLVLIDPVSVAGVVLGPPLFDLVKYESYAVGELPALRSEWVEVGGFDGSQEYTYRVQWETPELAPFRACDWHTLFRRRFEASYGPIGPRAYRLIDGYFSVAMAVNTGGVQRRARLLKATADFDAARAGS